MPKSKYYITDYFQKSLNLLFPLICKEKQIGILNTYLLAEAIDKNIMDYFLLCEIEHDIELNADLAMHLKEVYKTEDNTELCVFDMSSVAPDVEKFLSGSYSEYTAESKKRILAYYKWFKPNKKEVYSPSEIKLMKLNNVDIHFYVFLYPNQFKEEVAKDFSESFELYNTPEEALEVLKVMKELCSIYDLEKETFTKKLKQIEL